MIRAAVAAVLLGGGVGFILVASIGVARLPDVFQRSAFCPANPVDALPMAEVDQQIGDVGGERGLAEP